MTDLAATDAAFAASLEGRARFIHGLGIGQIVSWGALYYSFALIAEPMGRELGLSKPAIYGAATFGILVAGLASYPIGAAIDRGRGRLVMTTGSVLGGLLLMAWSQIYSLPVFYLLFGGIGLAQAMTMYEPAFAVVTRRYGLEARRGITAITLWGGFASTVFIPFTQLLLDHLGWRSAVFVLGACTLSVLGLHLWLIDPRRDAPKPSKPAATQPGSHETQPVRWVVRQPAFWGLLVAFTIYYGMYVGLTFHLYPMLLERGFAVATVIGALTIIGPAQVAGRIAMWVLAKDRSVRLIGLVSVGVFPFCLLLLILFPRNLASLVAFAVICGAANGVITIVRGLVVPEMLTREAYGRINGVLNIPATATKALAPAATAAMWALFGNYDGVLWMGFASAVVVVAAFAFAAAQRPITHGA
ncbi:MAG TPA: MFS transporter [bacterium]